MDVQWRQGRPDVVVTFFPFRRKRLELCRFTFFDILRCLDSNVWQTGKLIDQIDGNYFRGLLRSRGDPETGGIIPGLVYVHVESLHPSRQEALLQAHHSGSNNFSGAVFKIETHRAGFPHLLQFAAPLTCDGAINKKRIKSRFQAFEADRDRSVS